MKKTLRVILTRLPESKRDGQPAGTRDENSLPPVVFTAGDSMLPFVPRLIAENEQAARLQQLRLATTVFRMPKVHDTRRKQAQRRHRPIKRLVIAMQRDPLPR